MEIATWYKIPFEHKKNVLRKIENSVSRGNWHFVEIRDNKKWWMNELQCKHTKNWTSCHFPMICRRVFYFYLTCCTIVDAMQMENRNTITVKCQETILHVCLPKQKQLVHWMNFIWTFNSMAVMLYNSSNMNGLCKLFLAVPHSLKYWMKYRNIC